MEFAAEEVPLDLNEVIRKGIDNYLLTPPRDGYPDRIVRGELIAGVCSGIHADVHSRDLVQRGEKLKRWVRISVKNFLSREGYECQEGAVYVKG